MIVKKRTAYNPKRRIRELTGQPEDEALLVDLAARVAYGGNPEHKRNPRDFNLDPPSQPRQGKTLCDDLGDVTKSKAEDLLRNGVKRALISDQVRNGWPQNIWSVYEGQPVEAMLENSHTGTYHGYPMPDADPFRDEVLRHWNRMQNVG